MQRKDGFVFILRLFYLTLGDMGVFMGQSNLCYPAAIVQHDRRLVD